MTYKPLLIMERAGLYLTVDAIKRKSHDSRMPVVGRGRNIDRNEEAVLGRLQALLHVPAA
jgi:hypothetical protein